MSSEEFKNAQANLKKLSNDPGNDAKLKLYGYFKQATTGDCNVGKPNMIDVVGRAKWTAWNSLKKMSKKEAEQNYINFVNELLRAENPQLIEDNKETSAKHDARKFTDIEVSVVFGNVYKIVLNRPEKLNSLSSKMYKEIKEALCEAEKDEKISICCISGNGKFFSSGNDVTNYLSKTDDNQEKLIEDGVNLYGNFVESFIKFSKPLIALVNGPALGISFTILALFDLVIASDKAYFSAPFSAIALSPEGCSSYTFPRLMGTVKANEILLFNKKLTAQEAYERNLITQILPDNDFQSKAWKIIEDYSKFSEKSMVLAKNLMKKHDLEILFKVNEMEKKLLSDRLRSGEFLNYVMNFVNKKSKL